MSNNNSSSSGGIGILGMMFLIFMTLKLTGFINWSWWLVTAPLWGGFALLGLFVLVVIIISSLK